MSMGKCLWENVYGKMSMGKYLTTIEMDWWLIKSCHDIRLSMNIYNEHICKNNKIFYCIYSFVHAYQYRFSQAKTIVKL